MPFADGYLIYADRSWGCHRIAAKLFFHVLLVQCFYRVPIQLHFLRYVGYCHGSALPSHKIRKPLCIERIVRYPLQPLLLHFAAPSALYSPNLHFQIYPRISA